MQLLSRLVLEQTASTIHPSDAEIKKIYDEQVAKMDRLEYKARHILVKEEDEAKKVIKELDGGKKFEELAKAHSDGPTGKNGGDLGWFEPGVMPKVFDDVCFGLKPGQTSPLVSSEYGFHLFHLVALDEARERVRLLRGEGPEPADSVRLTRDPLRHLHQPRDIASVGDRRVPELRRGPVVGVDEGVHDESWAARKPRAFPTEMRPEDRAVPGAPPCYSLG